MSLRKAVTGVAMVLLLTSASAGWASPVQILHSGQVFSDTAESPARDALAFLAAWSIYRGDAGLGGPARPGDAMTRAEFTAVAARLLALDAEARGLLDQKPSFIDADAIPAWSWGYVNLSVEKDMIRGYPEPDGLHSFQAGNPITHAEALAVLTRALGLEARATGDWPMNYVNVAAEVGLTRGLEVSANAVATRGEIARMAYNAMVLVPVGPNPEVQGLVPGRPLADDGVETRRLQGTVTGVDAVQGTITLYHEPGDSSPGSETIPLADTTILLGAGSLQSMVNSEVKAYARRFEGEFRVGVLEVVGAAARISGTYWRTIAQGKDIPFDYLEITDGTLIEYISGQDPMSHGEVNRWSDRDLSLTLDRFSVRDKDEAFLHVEIQMTRHHGRSVVDRLVGTVWESRAWYGRYWWAAYDDDYLIMPDPSRGLAPLGGDGYRITPKNLKEEERPLTVDAHTEISLNGQPASLEDLREWDVLRVALDWSKSTDTEPAWNLLEPVVWKIEAHRERVSGRVVSHSSTGGVNVVVLDTVGGPREIQLDERIQVLPPAGSYVTYSLDPLGRAAARILEEEASSPSS